MQAISASRCRLWAVPSTRDARAHKKLGLNIFKLELLNLKKINVYANVYAFLLANCNNLYFFTVILMSS